MKKNIFGLTITLISLLFFQQETIAQVPANWNWVASSNNHTIAVLSNVVYVNGQTIQNGDVLGVFYNQPATGGISCAGYIIWNGSNNAISAWGNDTLTPVKEGFYIGEQFQFRLFRPSNGIIYDLNYVSWNTSLGLNNYQYAIDGQTILTYLSNLPTVNYYTFSLSGTVNYLNSGLALSNHPVQIIPADTMNYPAYTLMTNAAGQFSTELVFPDTLSMPVYVLTLGECGPTDIYSQTVNASSSNTSAAINFQVCQDTSVSTTCQAAFDYINLSPTGCYCADFTNLSSFGTGPVSYSWNFGDGSPASTLENPSHVFAGGAGNYQVCLSLTTSSGCTSTQCMNIFISEPIGPSCEALFTASSTNPSSSFMAFMNTSTGAMSEVLWDFGDGSTSNQIFYTSHSYADTGYYTVCLNIWTIDSCSDQYCQIIHYLGQNSPQTCSAQFQAAVSITTACSYGLGWQFNDLSTSSTSITSYLYDFGDGNFSTLANPEHCYADTGTYLVSLEIETAGGCSDSISWEIQVNDSVPPGCSASFSYIFQTNGDVWFMSSSSPNTVLWNWDFGDGTTSTQANPLHAYAPGSYQVCLTIETSDGCSDSYCLDSLEVTSQGTCFALFSSVLDTTGSCIGCYHFINQSWAASGSFSSQWNFGDGFSSTETNPTHIFSTTGQYIVSLSIVTTNGCTNTVQQFITVTQTGGYTLDGSVLANGLGINYGSISLLGINGSNANASIQNDGSFMFSGVQQGEYLLYAIPPFANYPSYPPTYYTSSLFWGTATGLNVSSDLNGLDISLYFLQNPTGGNGSISGWILYISGSKIANYKNLLDDSVEGIPVFILNEENVPVAFCLSQAGGYFEVSGLPFGIYKVQTEITGYTSYPATVSLSESNPSVNNILFVISEGTVVLGAETEELARISLFPNPAGDFIGILLHPSESGKYSHYQVSDISGKILLEGKLVTDDFPTISLSGLTKGSYMLQLTGKNANLRSRFVKM